MPHLPLPFAPAILCPSLLQVLAEFLLSGLVVASHGTAFVDIFAGKFFNWGEGKRIEQIESTICLRVSWKSLIK